MLSRGFFPRLTDQFRERRGRCDPEYITGMVGKKVLEWNTN